MINNSNLFKSIVTFSTNSFSGTFVSCLFSSFSAWTYLIVSLSDKLSLILVILDISTFALFWHYLISLWYLNYQTSTFVTNLICFSNPTSYFRLHLHISMIMVKKISSFHSWAYFNLLSFFWCNLWIYAYFLFNSLLSFMLVYLLSKWTFIFLILIFFYL